VTEFVVVVLTVVFMLLVVVKLAQFNKLVDRAD
jgi:hypothetical protein